MESEETQDVTSHRRSDYANNQIANEAEPPPTGQVSGQPTHNQANHQESDQSHNHNLALTND